MGKIDYAELWRQQMLKKTADGNSYLDPSAAEAYDRSASIWADGYHRAALLPVTSADSVLDVGSGPGVLAVPLAKKARAVTVVEPSAAMIELLFQHCREEGIQNITVVNARWEEAADSGLPAFDYVIASYSLAMPEIRQALAAMDRIARKRVYLYWFCGLASWEKLMVDLYPMVYGIPFAVQPKSDLLLGVLHQLGIGAKLVHLKGTAFDRFYKDTESAVCDLKGRLHLTSDEFDDRLEEYIRRHYEPNGKGWFFRDRTDYVELSWEAQGKKEGNVR